ncbi:nucleoside phosphorylase domain-containing protein [Halenospora varia]|nr:nucleoside phosphorylase domain-containing protein [Halenospora varia]
MANQSRPSNRNDFEIAIICVLKSEADAVEASFDEFWDEDGSVYGKAPGDPNAYATGRIGHHNVVLAFMPGMGKGAAAHVASSVRSSFEGIILALVVGICGGVPLGIDGQDIMLGDVVISTGIVQYDFGRRLPERFIRKDTLESNLGRPNPEIRALLSKMEGHRGNRRLQGNTWGYLKTLLDMEQFKRAQYPGPSEDRLFEAAYRHKHHDISYCATCAKCEKKEDLTCQQARESGCAELQCDESRTVHRQLEHGEQSAAPRCATPAVHFGTIASGDTVMKSGEDRDDIARQEMVIAFEMEGAGVWDAFPCIVIKGVCDYADSHKNKKWQAYAALSAAACMKAFLKEWTTAVKLPTAGESGKYSSLLTRAQKS